MAGLSSAAPDALAAYVRDEPDGTSALNLMVENMHCAGCVRRIESAFQPLPGIVEARANLSARRLRLRWRGDGTNGAALVERLASLGYRAVPFDPEEMV